MERRDFVKLVLATAGVAVVGLTPESHLESFERQVTRQLAQNRPDVTVFDFHLSDPDGLMTSSDVDFAARTMVDSVGDRGRDKSLGGKSSIIDRRKHTRIGFSWERVRT